jgi:hypothetical protein
MWLAVGIGLLGIDPHPLSFRYTHVSSRCFSKSRSRAIIHGRWQDYVGNLGRVLEGPLLVLSR